MTRTILLPFESAQKNGVWFCRVAGTTALVGPFATRSGVEKFATIGILDPIVDGRQIFCSRDELNRKWKLLQSGVMGWGGDKCESVYFFERALAMALGAEAPKYNYWNEGAINHPRPILDDWQTDKWVDPAPWAGDLVENRRAIARLAAEDAAYA